MHPILSFCRSPPQYPEVRHGRSNDGPQQIQHSYQDQPFRGGNAGYCGNYAQNPDRGFSGSGPLPSNPNYAPTPHVKFLDEYALKDLPLSESKDPKTYVNWVRCRRAGRSEMWIALGCLQRRHYAPIMFEWERLDRKNPNYQLGSLYYEGLLVLDYWRSPVATFLRSPWLYLPHSKAAIWSQPLGSIAR